MRSRLITAGGRRIRSSDSARQSSLVWVWCAFRTANAEDAEDAENAETATATALMDISANGTWRRDAHQLFFVASSARSAFIRLICFTHLLMPLRRMALATARCTS